MKLLIVLIHVDIMSTILAFKKCSKILSIIRAKSEDKDRIRTALKRNKEISFRNKDSPYFIFSPTRIQRGTKRVFEGIV